MLTRKREFDSLKKVEKRLSHLFHVMLTERPVILYTILFCCIGVIIFSPFLLYQRTFLWNEDGYLQYFAKLAKVKHIINDLISEKKFDFWSWDTGLGTDTIGNYGGLLFDPTTYIVALFPMKYLDIAYSIIAVIKIYLAGLAVFAFQKYHKKSSAVVIFSALYSFSIDYFRNGLD